MKTTAQVREELRKKNEALKKARAGARGRADKAAKKQEEYNKALDDAGEDVRGRRPDRQSRTSTSRRSRTSIPVQQMTTTQQKNINKVMGEAIVAYERAGEGGAEGDVRHLDRRRRRRPARSRSFKEDLPTGRLDQAGRARSRPCARARAWLIFRSNSTSCKSNGTARSRHCGAGRRASPSRTRSTTSAKAFAELGDDQRRRVWRSDHGHRRRRRRDECRGRSRRTRSRRAWLEFQRGQYQRKGFAADGGGRGGRRRRVPERDRRRRACSKARSRARRSASRSPARLRARPSARRDRADSRLLQSAAKKRKELTQPAR